MPGLYGIVADRQLPGDVFDRLFSRGAEGFRRESFVDPSGRWALGRGHLGIFQPGRQLPSPTEAPNTGTSGDLAHVYVLLHGELHRRGSQPTSAGSSERTDAEVVAALYGAYGLEFARHLDGAYAVAIVDARERRTVLATDAVGSYPLYWTQAGGDFVFGSDVGAVLTHPQSVRSLDPRAVADYITFGFPMGVRTLADAVHMVPAGAILVYDWDRQAVRVDQVHRIESAFAPWTGTRQDYLQSLCDTFQHAVEHAVSGEHPIGLSLSGGLDSRAILSAVNGKSGELKTYTLGVKGCADEVIGARLARIAGTRHSFFELDNRYLKDFLPNLERMVALTDGMYLSHGLTEMLAFGFLASAGFSVLLRGHGGELAKTRLAWPLHTDDVVYGLSSREELVSYLLGRVNYISPNVDLRELFTETWVNAMEGGARQSLDDATKDVSLPPADLCSFLYLTQHHRRSTIPSLELFRRVVEVRMPFVDPQFLSVLFRGETRWRDDTSIHRALTEAGNRALARVRNSNTGAPANAGPAIEFALDKVNSLFKRLNMPGYRHYHNFQAWMEAQLLASVETVLLSPASLDRGILREPGVRRLLDDTRHGRGDHSYLLQVLLILELWQRQNL